MRRGALSARDRRAIRLGVVTGVLLIGARLSPVMARSWRQNQTRQQIALDSMRLGERALREVGNLRTRVADYRRLAGDVEGGALTARNLSAAAAALAARITDAADAAGVQIESLQTLEDSSQSSSFGSVRVRGEMRSDIEGLATLVQFIENDSLRLVVRELEITAPDVSIGDAQPQTLNARVTVQALVRPEVRRL